MWNYIKYAITGSKIAMDRTYDTVIWHLPYWNIQSESSESDDIIFSDDLYQPESASRLFKPSSYYESYSYFSGDPTLIVDNIYLGSAFNAGSYDVLKKHDIRVIINVTAELSNYFPNDFIYYNYPLYDDNKDGIIKYLDSAFDNIKYHQNNTSGNILIHCFAGASRSASIMIYYIMKTMVHDDGTPYLFDEAAKFVRNKRSIVNPTFKLSKDVVNHMRKSE